MEFKISSDTIGLISEALSKAQGEIQTAIKESAGARSKYADLAAVKDACQIPLSKNGLSMTGGVIKYQDEWIYVGTLSHTSGEWFRSYVPLITNGDKINPMQSFGSAQTYAERYAIKSLVYVACAKEDDDGESSYKQESKKTDIDRPQQKISHDHVKHLRTLITDEEEDKIIKGYAIGSLNDLAIPQYQACLKRFSKSEVKNG